MSQIYCVIRLNIGKNQDIPMRFWIPKSLLTQNKVLGGLWLPAFKKEVEETWNFKGWSFELKHISGESLLISAELKNPEDFDEYCRDNGQNQNFEQGQVFKMLIKNDCVPRYAWGEHIESLKEINTKAWMQYVFRV